MPILCISKNAICRSLFTEKILFHLQNYKTSEYFSDIDAINIINPLDELPLLVLTTNKKLHQLSAEFWDVSLKAEHHIYFWLRYRFTPSVSINVATTL